MRTSAAHGKASEKLLTTPLLDHFWPQFGQGQEFRVPANPGPSEQTGGEMQALAVSLTLFVVMDLPALSATTARFGVVAMANLRLMSWANILDPHCWEENLCRRSTLDWKRQVYLCPMSKVRTGKSGSKEREPWARCKCINAEAILAEPIARQSYRFHIFDTQW